MSLGRALTSELIFSLPCHDQSKKIPLRPLLGASRDALWMLLLDAPPPLTRPGRILGVAHKSSTVPRYKRKFRVVHERGGAPVDPCLNQVVITRLRTIESGMTRCQNNLRSRHIGASPVFIGAFVNAGSATKMSRTTITLLGRVAREQTSRSVNQRCL